MTAKPNAVVASLIACAVLAVVPACGSVPRVHPEAPRVVTVTEPDGSVHITTAASVGIGSIHRHAGQQVEYYEVNLDGSAAWGFLSFLGVVTSISLVGTLIMIIIGAIQDSKTENEEATS
jgi:hypothetical protein